MMERQTTSVRLKFEGEYDSGARYREWELLVDCPEIPATKPGANPMHAIAGDVLREEMEDDLAPFQLRRNGRRIGDPEWWQVKHLFGGERPAWGAPGGVQGSQTGDALRFWRNDGEAATWKVLRELPDVRVDFRGIRHGEPNHLLPGDVLMENIVRESDSSNEPETSSVFVNRDGEPLGYLDLKSFDRLLRQVATTGGGVIESQPIRKDVEKAVGATSTAAWRITRDCSFGYYAVKAGTLLVRASGRWFIDTRPAPAYKRNGVYRIRHSHAARVFKWQETDTDPEAKRASNTVVSLREWDGEVSLFQAREPIPQVGVEAGDVFLLHRNERPAVRGTVRPLTLDDYEALRAILDERGSLPARDVMPCPYGASHRTGTLEEFIGNRNKWGKKLKEWRSRVAVVRPFERTVQPIQARSDDEAIFELLAEVGCRMPENTIR